MAQHRWRMQLTSPMLSQIFFNLVFVQAISVAFIPIFLSIEKSCNAKRAAGFGSNLIFFIGCILAFFSIIVFAFSDKLVPLFASGFSDETCAMAVQLTRIGCWFLLLQSPIMVFGALLQAKKKFVIPALFGLVLDATSIGFIALSSLRNQLWLMGLVPVAVSVVECLLLIPPIKKLGFSFKTNFPNFWADMKVFWGLAIPSVISVGLNQLNVLVSKNLASNITVGGISAYNYAWTVVNIYESLLVSSVCVVFFSEFSDSISKGNNEEAKKTFSNGFYILSSAVILFSVFTVFFAKPIISVIYERGAFDSTASNNTAECLSPLAVGSPFLVLSNYGLRYLYSYKKSKIAALFSIISFAAGIGTNLCLFFFTSTGLKGLGIATAVLNLVNFFLIFFYIRSVLRTPFLNQKYQICCFDIFLFLEALLLKWLYGGLYAHFSSGFLSLMIVGIIYLLLSGLFWCFLNKGKIKRKIGEQRAKRYGH
jgi:putative peptidoglycan lipid II flippase